jgi:hypothetical protein
VPSEPFEPYGIAAVELSEEKMVVLGQVARGVDMRALTIGMHMELISDVLYADDAREYLVWKWRPAAGAAPRGAGVP